MPTVPTGTAAEAAVTESTETQDAPQAAKAAEDAQPAEGSAAPEPSGPAVPPSYEALLASDDPEERKRGAKLFEQSLTEPTDPEEAAAGTETDAHVEPVEEAEANNGAPAAEADEADAEEDTDDAPKLSKRVKLKGVVKEDVHFKLDRALYLQRKDPERPFTDILQEVGLAPAAAAEVAKATGAEAVEEQAPPPANVAELETQIATLEDELDDNPFDAELRKSNRAKIREANQQIADARQFQAELAAKVGEHSNRIIGAIPDFAKAGTPIANAAARLNAEIQRDNPGFFLKADFPMKFAKLVLMEADRADLIPLLNGKKPEAAKPANGAKPAAPPAEKPRAAKRNGVPSAMLATGQGGDDGGGLMARVQNDTASYDELRELGKVLGT